MTNLVKYSNINKKASKKRNITANKVINIKKKWNILGNRKLNIIANKTVNSSKEWNFITNKKLNIIANKAIHIYKEPKKQNSKIYKDKRLDISIINS